MDSAQGKGIERKFSARARREPAHNDTRERNERTSESRQESGNGGQRQVVGAVGDEFVAEGFLDFAIFDEKDAGHLLDVPGRKKSEMTVNDGEDHAEDGFRIEKLANGNAGESEGFVETRCGVAEAGDIGKIVALHEVTGFVLRTHVHEGELRAAGGNFPTPVGQIRNHFTAEGTAEMAKKDKKDGARGTQGRQRLAVRGEKLTTKSGVDFLQEEHVRFYFARKRIALRLVVPRIRAATG